MLRRNNLLLRTFAIIPVDAILGAGHIEETARRIHMCEIEKELRRKREREKAVVVGYLKESFPISLDKRR